ncbi:hypothetical protein SEUCBS140593_008154 [Sporothrix eucalyptigena]|uniref:Aminoglycoside phosphotransferase domain-containing protein n=1 Tax=Sporothrix eucalyptigena TaxID=1812306 RepID=A0ABP0CJ44_9PEZI
MQQHGPLEITEFDRMAGGHGNQTYLAKITKKNGKEQDMIVRRADDTQLILWGPFLLEQQYLLMKCLNKTDFPLPKVFDFGNKANGIDNGSFITMEKLAGKITTLYLNSGSEDTGLTESMALQLAEVLAKLHTYTLTTFSDFFAATGADVGEATRMTVEDTYRQSLQTWGRYLEEVEHTESTYLAWLLDWTKRNVPLDHRPAVLVHGDFAPHNILFDGGKISGVLDYECANFGAPEQDLVYLKPHVAKILPWASFIDRYKKSGGATLVEENFSFCQAYAALKTAFAFARGATNLAKGYTQDIRLLMVEFAYQPMFMKIGLDAVPRPSMSSPVTAAQTSVSNSVLKAGMPQTLIPEYGEEANIRQPLQSHPNFQDSVVLVWWDKENGLGGFHRLGHEPNRPGGGEAVLWTNIVTPAGIFKRTQTKPLRGEKDQLAGGGWGSGDKTCQFTYKDKEHTWMINEPDVDLTARLVHTDTGPNVDCFPKRGDINDKFNAAHFDIPGMVSGTLSIKGKTYQIRNALSIRDHGWGNREWGTGLLSHRWVAGSCGPEFSFIVVGWHGAADNFASFGWVVRDGVVTMAKNIDIVAYMNIDSCSNRGGQVLLELETQERFEIQCTPVAKGFLSWHRGLACMDRLCSVRVTGEQAEYEGIADFETTANFHAGTREPTALFDGVLHNGFTPA